MKFPDIREQFPFDAVVLANGEQPAHDVPLNILREAPYVVCCDGAIQHCDWADAVVGDCDSIPSWAREEYDIIYHEEDDQEENDLTNSPVWCSLAPPECAKTMPWATYRCSCAMHVSCRCRA